MFKNHKLLLFISLITLALLISATASAAPSLLPQRVDQASTAAFIGTAFTYQGRLTANNGPANGAYDFSFSLYDAAQVGNLVGTAVAVEDLPVTDGLFTVSLDFGSVFVDTALWLEIAVRGGSSSGEYTLLSPRQALTDAPYAAYALDTARIGGLSPADIFQIGGNAVITDAILGTTSEYGMEIRVNDQRALGVFPHEESPNLVGGHSANWVGDDVYGAVIAGGGESANPNSVTDTYGTLGGGYSNTASYGASVGGGGFNTASGTLSSVAGGGGNTASDSCSTVAGGYHNTASGDRSTVSGGTLNTASGYAAVVPGGQNNEAQGAFSFAAGRRAKATLNGCFVWADATTDDLNCGDVNRTYFRSSGGFVIYTNPSKTSGTFLLSGGSSWNAFSARQYKENFAPVDPSQLLERLAAIEITTWNYKAQDPAIRHIGPMADDFNALVDSLGGEGQEYINTLDADGVALAAIQGLYSIAKQQGEQISALEARLAALEALLAQSGAGEQP